MEDSLSISSDLVALTDQGPAYFPVLSPSKYAPRLVYSKCMPLSPSSASLVQRLIKSAMWSTESNSSVLSVSFSRSCSRVMHSMIVPNSMILVSVLRNVHEAGTSDSKIMEDKAVGGYAGELSRQSRSKSSASMFICLLRREHTYSQ